MGVEVRHFQNSTVNIESLGNELAMWLLTEKKFTLTFKGLTFEKGREPEYKIKLIKSGFLRRFSGVVYTFDITLQRINDVVTATVNDGNLHNQLVALGIAATIFWPILISAGYGWMYKGKLRKDVLKKVKTLLKPAWYDNKVLVVVLIILFWPVGLYGLWKMLESRGYFANRYFANRKQEPKPQLLIGKQKLKPQETSNTNKISEKKFKVTLLGIADGSNREETEAKLAAIFKKTPNQIRTLLDKRAVIGNNLVRDKAIKYKQALEKAGALYKIKTIKQDLPSEPKTYCRNCGSEVR